MFDDFSTILLNVEMFSHRHIRTNVIGLKLSVCYIWNNLLKNIL